MWLLWWLLFGFVYTVIQLKKDDDVAAELLFFWINPAWDLFDLVSDWYVYWRLRYVIWKVKRKLKKAEQEHFQKEITKHINNE